MIQKCTNIKWVCVQIFVTDANILCQIILTQRQISITLAEVSLLWKLRKTLIDSCSPGSHRTVFTESV